MFRLLWCRIGWSMSIRQVNIDLTRGNRLAERSERRTNLFVAATLSWPQGFAPTTIRNLSPAGALIEASVLPKPGVSVQLTRGSLTIAGEVVWCEGRRAGLKFGGRIAVADWLPSGSGLAQAQVDQVVHAVKAGIPSSRMADASKPAPASRSQAGQVAELEILLGLVAEGLADDSSVVARHGDKLQILDMVRQRLVRLSEPTKRPEAP